MRLTFEGDNQTPVWSPDGSQIIYSSNRNDTWHIFRRAADGSGEEQGLLSSEYRHQACSWHPAGRVVALAYLNARAESDIVMLAPDERRLSTTFIKDTPHFSPDGRWLAWYGNESGGVEIYAQPYPGPGRRVMVSRGGGPMPFWSRDGRELFYHWRGRIYSVSVTAGSEPGFGTPRVILEGRYHTSFDVSPDPRHIVVVRNEQGVLPRQVHVVLNWMDELR